MEGCGPRGDGRAGRRVRWCGLPTEQAVVRGGRACPRGSEHREGTARVTAPQAPPLADEMIMCVHSIISTRGGPSRGRPWRFEYRCHDSRIPTPRSAREMIEVRRTGYFTEWSQGARRRQRLLQRQRGQGRAAERLQRALEPRHEPSAVAWTEAGFRGAAGKVVPSAALLHVHQQVEGGRVYQAFPRDW